MFKKVLLLVAGLSCVSVVQAVDYKGLYDSLDKQKVSGSVDMKKAGSALMR